MNEGQTDRPEEGQEEIQTPVNPRLPKGIQWEKQLMRLSKDFTVADLANDLGVTTAAVYAARRSVQKKLNRVQDLLDMPQTARKTETLAKCKRTVDQNERLNPSSDLSDRLNQTEAKPVSVSETDLAAIRSGDPAQVEAALARIAAGAMAEGILSIPEPRTVAELTKWLQAWRQVTGRDKQASAQPQTVGLIMPVKTLRRANGKTVEASPDSMEAIPDPDPDGSED